MDSSESRSLSSFILYYEAVCVFSYILLSEMFHFEGVCTRHGHYFQLAKKYCSRSNILHCFHFHAGMWFLPISSMHLLKSWWVLSLFTLLQLLCVEHRFGGTVALQMFCPSLPFFFIRFLTLFHFATLN